MKNFLFVFGTRPEWLKIKPILDKLGLGNYKLLFTGQHPDLLKDIKVNYNIVITEDSTLRLDQLVCNCIAQFPNDHFSGVLVQGDTASAFACSIAAFHRGLRIFYLEAGLRSYDLNHPYPEEGYRQMIARIADVNFAPTDLSKANLEAERVNGKIYVVGNTILDNLVGFNQGIYGNDVLVTLHRRENHDSIKDWFNQIENLANCFPYLNFVLPIHPNPNVYVHKNLLNKVKVVEPLTHQNTIELIRNCRTIITDSGGLQEEGSFFNKKVIVCRLTTERPEGISTGHLYLCKEPKQLYSLFENIVNNPLVISNCPYGDGHASEKIIKILTHEM
jgi:UDP-N-acetylglucosamine 2-epimerase (non-hydrolysing)